ncbi:MAG: hypothetical protein A2846_02940 [Candidatus Doudnabacteria bacterium RIFCSPHIGHO2_01_FULL_49_9]|uniref:Glycosyltransferase 2-like domain-containing protein n=1 Tax=Candidatus Doudnabacteria bacterium RIFCSPHIGHO2_01_FULL_49_9 TaxID=1817827 RepID=A0A1F5P304_9BACT|nr:MAG: hypothetical protein A2846_02940 [Candidatus Doudnabacteria bacterium RIFCSPHIGHO2_01_FULL_49_9]
MDLSVIIVSFNTSDRLRQCLRSVFNSTAKSAFEVFVVDNASADGSAEMVAAEFPKVRLIKNPENLGYSKANNVALRKILSPLPTPPHQGQGNSKENSSPRSGGGEVGGGKIPRYVLLLNPDVEISRDSFDKMISFMDNDKSIGIAGCKVMKSDGTLDKASRRSFPNFQNSLRYFLGLRSSYNLDLPDDEIAEVDSVMGAFLMIRSEAVDKIGLLDEAFFMYGEDLDWCYRAKQAGYKVMYAPMTTVIHHKGSSSRKLPGKALYEFHRAMFVFYDKHYSAQHNAVVNYLVKVGIWARYCLKVMQNFLRTDKYVSK